MLFRWTMFAMSSVLYNHSNTKHSKLDYLKSWKCSVQWGSEIWPFEILNFEGRISTVQLFSNVWAIAMAIARCCVFRPAFECCMYPKAGQNTQQLLSQPFKNWTIPNSNVLSGFQMVFDKMAAICPDFKCFNLSVCLFYLGK